MSRPKPGADGSTRILASFQLERSLTASGNPMVFGSPLVAATALSVEDASFKICVKASFGQSDAPLGRGKSAETSVSKSRTRFGAGQRNEMSSGDRATAP